MLTESGIMMSVRNAGIDSVGSCHSTWRNPPIIIVPTSTPGFGVVPIDNFDPLNGRWGAFEIAGRVSNTDINDGLFKAKLARGSDNTWAYTGGLNWYFNKNFKAQFNYTRTDFSQNVTFGNTKRDHEDVLLSRFQLAF